MAKKTKYYAIIIDSTNAAIEFFEPFSSQEKAEKAIRGYLLSSFEECSNFDVADLEEILNLEAYVVKGIERITRISLKLDFSFIKDVK